LKLSLPEPVEGNIPAENHLRQAQVAMNCVTHHNRIHSGLFPVIAVLSQTNDQETKQVVVKLVGSAHVAGMATIG
jgi:hypothetical protein